MFKLFLNLIFLLLFTNNVIAETVMCPETITCNNESKTCNLPKDFFIDYDLLREAPNQGKFFGDLTLAFNGIWLAKTTIIEKKINQ